MKLQPKGVFCLEGDWWNNLKQPSSVEPLLALLDQQLTYRRRHIHRDVGTIEEFRHYLKKWAQGQMADYPILYLAFHGESGLIKVGDGRRADSDVTLDVLQEELKGKCANRLIHFGSCQTLNVTKWDTNRFLKETGALAVSGYCRYVDWMASAAFELLVLSELQYGRLTIKGLEKTKDRIREAAGGLHRTLEFRMEIRDPAWSFVTAAAG